MASAAIEQFIQAIVSDHGLATGIKPLGNHYDIVAYANIRGYAITLAEWGRFVAMDCLQASDEDLVLLHRADPSHWSWAFRQVSRWRTLLMDGAGAEGLLGPADFVAPSPSSSVVGEMSQPVAELTDAQKDAELFAFIQRVKSDPGLKEQIKLARNQDDVLAIAEANGAIIDSLALLRSWSQVTDFSKPTWFGWFDD